MRPNQQPRNFFFLSLIISFSFFLSFFFFFFSFLYPLFLFLTDFSHLLLFSKSISPPLTQSKITNLFRSFPTKTQQNQIQKSKTNLNGGKVFEHGREVNGNVSTDTLSILAGLEKSSDTAHGELKPDFLSLRNGL
jgi:hypothetical protein